MIIDVKCENQQYEIIQKEYRRSHRNAKENKLQILYKYYLPRMFALIKKYVTNCYICNTHKYDRNPPSPQLQETPTLSMPCEILHMDITEIQDEKLMCVIDKFSKFGNIREKLVKILNIRE